jgi:DNA modification methylase
MSYDRERKYTRDGVTIYNDDVLKLYQKWDTPLVIISDGGYGISGFPGDPPEADDLPSWYEPHIAEWSKKATPQTTLWFWNREIGWAKVHPVLEKYGWEYVFCNIWDKGMAHIAGGVNGKTLRRFPQVTEVCVYYVKKAEFKFNGRIVDVKEWLRLEWERTGLPISKTNEACGVIDAATRKYFTKDHLWYFPPPARFGKLGEYANKHGKPEGRPYFSKDGLKSLTAEDWSLMRPKFHLETGITNVWRELPLHNYERLKENGRIGKAIHLNQKPLKLIELAIRASSDEGDVIWEPFGGLCTAAIASHKLKRKCFSAEINSKLYQFAVERLKDYDKSEADRNGTKRMDAFLSMEESKGNTERPPISL